MIVTHKLPILHRSKNPKESSEKLVGCTIFNKVIEKDEVDCVIHYWNISYDNEYKF